MTVTTKPPAQAKRRAKAKPPPEQARQPESASLKSPSPTETPSGTRAMALPPEDWPDMSHIVTEDDTPVDNIFSEKQQRLLTESLYASWRGPGADRPYVALANVGLFYALYSPPLVPDMLLSLDVEMPDEVWTKVNRSYFVWVYGKPPDVVVEVVSNREGGEADRKLAQYARIGVPYCVIFDPEGQLSREPLRVYRNSGGTYRRTPNGELPQVGLGVRLWAGEYEDLEATWLRWFDAEGNLILTGAERAASAEQQAADARQQAADAQQLAADAQRQAADARQQAVVADERATRLADKLRALGVDPDA